MTTVYEARVLNQYGKPIGYGTSNARDEAVRLAKDDANATLRGPGYNRNWKWRKASIKVRTI